MARQSERMMMQLKNLSSDKMKLLSYLVGALQGDGCLYKFDYNGKEITRIIFGVKDIELARKVQEAFIKLFERRNKIVKMSNGTYRLTVSAKALSKLFDRLHIYIKDPPNPPLWITNKIETFGAYLAGLIDTDGDVRIKKPKYPQCAIRITSGHLQEELKKYIGNSFNCGVNIQKDVHWNKKWKIWSRSYRLEFLVSRKNMNLIKEFVLPYIQIPRKRNKLENFVMSLNARVAESG